MALFRVLNTLLPKGVEPMVVSIMAIQGEHFPTMGLDVRSLDMPRARLNRYAIAKLRAIVQEFQPDVIQGWMYHSNVLAHLARCFMPTGHRPPLAIAIRGSLSIFHQEKRLTRLIIRLDAWLSRWANRVFYVSRLACQQHNDFGYAVEHALVIPNGFDCQAFKPSDAARTSLRAELGLDAKVRLIGLVASWQPLKNHRGFLAAAAMLAQRYSDVHFLCAGRGVSANNPDLMALVPPAIHSRVHLLGERGDMPALTAALDIAVNASYAEAFPNVVGEAMACGVPMVVTDVGDSAWIIDGCGQVVPPGEDTALCDAMDALLSLPSEVRQALGMRARQRVLAHFSLELVAESYRQQWLALLGQKKD